MKPTCFPTPQTPEFYKDYLRKDMLNIFINAVSMIAKTELDSPEYNFYFAVIKAHADYIGTQCSDD